MTKHEILILCAEKRKTGWVTHERLLELFDHSEQVPDWMVDIICHEPYPPQEITLYFSEESLKAYNQALRQFLEP